ncbi:hypothetical protein [Polynucleobacter sp. Fuers-14]|uniref:hypothetical protein n=1 Tax=Polynucleobacter sp. Fuers-14 TaxID=1758364 RepID=UPI001C0C691F|nr:hypothetical protein [Polynucleobacter sp. Fuers-14]MBU3640962.1 hypothetical protein [Polynucleobacter sp. Fuers-14]
MSYGYLELYQSLSQLDLSRVARKARTDIDDVRQEARLLCWSIASGTSSFCREKGSQKQYIMGCLWGLAKHEHFQSQQAANETTDFILETLEDVSPTPLEKLLELEDIKAGCYLPETAQLTANMSLEESLWFSGMSFAAISKYTGIGKTTLHKRITQKFQPKGLK